MRHFICIAALSLALITSGYAEPHLPNSSRQPLDREGTSLALHAGRLLSGAPSNDAGEPGRVYEYRFMYDPVMPWTERSPITSPLPISGGQFGSAIASWTFRTVVGAPDELVDGPIYSHRSGAAYVLESTGSSWNVIQRLHDISLTTLNFGQAVAVDSQRVVIGSYDKVHIYSRECPCGPEGTGGRWVHDTTILAPESNARFGQSIAMTRNWLAVGAAGTHDGENESGIVYMYKKEEGEWSLDSILRPPVANHCGHFGSSLDIRWSLPIRLVVAAPGGFGNYECSDDRADGQVYVYEHNRVVDEWEVTFQSGMAPGFAGDDVFGDGFAKSIGAAGNMLAVGAHDQRRGSTLRSRAFVYRYFPDESAWIRVAALSPDDAVHRDDFGSAIDTDGICVAVGASARSGPVAAMAEQHDLQGATYIFCDIPSGYVGDEPRIEIDILCCEIPPDPVGPIGYELNLKAVGLKQENVINLRASLTYPDGYVVDIEHSDFEIYPGSEVLSLTGEIDLGEDVVKGSYKLSVFVTSKTGRTDIKHYRFTRE